LSAAKIAPIAELPGALHDIGKVSPGFQLKYFRSYLWDLCPELTAMTAQHFETDLAAVSTVAVNRLLCEE